MVPNPAAGFYDNLGMKYEESFGDDPGLIAFVGSVLELLPPEARVLDVGSGTGKPTSSMIAALGHQLYGIDFSSVIVDISRRQVPQGKFELVNMFESAPKDGQYDAVFAVFSLFHFSREEMSSAAAKFSE